MSRRNMNWGLVWGALILMILLAGVMLTGMLRQPTRLVLPDTGIPSDSPQEGSGTEDSALTVVEVKPTTVQAAIETLARPEEYSRTISIQHLWNGGNGSYEVSVTVCGEWRHTDRLTADGQTRHVITGPDQTWVWYNQERKVFVANLGDVTGDEEQTIPTYEDILDLPAGAIAVADYRVISDVNSIYTETVPDDDGYVMRYWVSVDTGLLVAAERLQHEEPVYRMTSMSVDQTDITAERFTLPDGTVLYDPPLARTVS